MREAEHLPAIRRIAGIVDAMRAPGSPLGGMRSADVEHPPIVPLALDLSRVDAGTIADRLADGVVERLRGVFLPGEVEPTFEDTILTQVRGLVDGTTAPLWFSHTTAALLHGAWLYRTPSLVHVTRQWNPHVDEEAEPMVRRHHTTLPVADRATVRGVPVTSLARTLVDCIRGLPRDGALVVCDSLIRLGADLDEVSRVMSASRGKRGVVQARSVLDLCDPRSGSPGETVARLVASDAGLPRADCQIEVATARGTFFVDLGWEDVRVAVEFDGAIKYSGGEHGDPDAVRRAEAARQEALEAAGWIVVRVRWEDLDDPVALEQRLRAAYRVGRRRSILGLTA